MDTDAVLVDSVVVGTVGRVVVFNILVVAETDTDDDTIIEVDAASDVVLVGSAVDGTVDLGVCSEYEAFVGSGIGIVNVVLEVGSGSAVVREVFE